MRIDNALVDSRVTLFQDLFPEVQEAVEAQVQEVGSQYQEVQQEGERVVQQVSGSQSHLGLVRIVASQPTPDQGGRCELIPLNLCQGYLYHHSFEIGRSGIQGP